MPEPAIVDAHAAGETNPAVDDEQLARRAVVDVWLDLPPVLAAVEVELHARVAQPLAIVVAEMQAAHAVEQRMDFYSGARALRQRVDELVADVPRRPDVVFKR